MEENKMNESNSNVALEFKMSNTAFTALQDTFKSINFADFRLTKEECWREVIVAELQADKKILLNKIESYEQKEKDLQGKMLIDLKELMMWLKHDLEVLNKANIDSEEEPKPETEPEPESVNE